jgi:hypothetical protein
MARIRYDSRLKGNRWLWLEVAMALVLIVCAVLVGWNLKQSAEPVLPVEIQRQLSFSPLIPSKRGAYTTDSFKYDASKQILSYKLTDGQHTVVVTEQSQPVQFTEIAGYQEQFLTNVIQQSETIQTSNGTVYLGHPSKQPTQQVAVMLDRGLLVFMTPQNSNELSSNEWRGLVEQLEIQKVL